MILLVIAALAFGLIALAWVVYPAAMWLRVRDLRAGSLPLATATGGATVVVATRDDPALVRARVVNLRAGDYPPSLLRVVVAVDRGSAFAVDTYREALGSLAETVQGDLPGGKAANLNAAVRAAAGSDILVFADVGQEFTHDTIRQMVSALQDERLGGVAGRYTQRQDDSVMSAFARVEAVIRAGQARSHSVVSTSGSIYAIRAALWTELPPGLICDDLFTTLSIVRQGWRVGFCQDAIAFDPRSFTRDQQFVRRVRTLTGLIQYCTLQPRVLLPWSNPIWAHFILHKVLRLLTPILLAIGLLAFGTFVALNAPGVLVALVIGAIAIAILVRLVAPRAFKTIAGQLGWVLRLQLVPGLAIANGLRRRWTVWTPTPQGNGNHAGAGAGA